MEIIINIRYCDLYVVFIKSSRHIVDLNLSSQNKVFKDIYLGSLYNHLMKKQCYNQVKNNRVLCMK